MFPPMILLHILSTAHGPEVNICTGHVLGYTNTHVTIGAIHARHSENPFVKTKVHNI